MKAEIIGVGTELLLGQIANTNAQKISEWLGGAGVDVFRHTVIGDNLDRAAGAIRDAMERADVVIVTGGLGPTPDDLTREAAAIALGVGLVRDQATGAALRAFFEERGRNFPEENLRQADRPEGAEMIPAHGTAPGFIAETASSLLIALPGVPWEMEAMMSETVLPLLTARSGAAVTVSREVLVVGMGESHVHERIADLVAAQTNPTIAYLAGGGRVRVRITAKAEDEGAALQAIRPLEAEIAARLGEAVAGEGDSIASVLADLVRARGLTIASAESLTGGLIAAEMTEHPGASEFYLGGLVCYSTESKASVAGVSRDTLGTFGAVSAETAGELAEAAARAFGASLGLGVTGVAGPSEQEGKTPGVIFIGATFGGRTRTRRVQGYGNRSNVRAIAVTAALDLGRRMLQE